MENANNNEYIYMCRFIPTKRNIKSWKLDKKIKKSLMKLIGKRKESGENVMQEKGPKDLLGLMIQASNCSSNITDYDIVEECKCFFFAGKQTTANLLTWTTVLLAMHSQWQVLARDEVLRVCGARDIPTKDDVVKLKTVSNLIRQKPLSFVLFCLLLLLYYGHFCHSILFFFFNLVCS